MSIHAKIKQLREAKEWSHQRLADEVSNREGGKRRLTWQAVQQWENAKSAPKRERLRHVADALGTTVAELMGEDEQRSAPVRAPSDRPRLSLAHDDNDDSARAAAARAEICAALSRKALALAMTYDRDPVMRGSIETALRIAGIGITTEDATALPGNVHKITDAPVGGRRQTSPTPPASGPEQYKDPHQRLDDEVRKKRGRGRDNGEEGDGDGERH